MRRGAHRRSRLSFVSGAFAGALGTGLIATVLFIQTDVGRTHPSLAATSDVRIRPSPSNDQQGTTTTAVFPERALGTPLELGVYRIKTSQLGSIDPCTLHYFDAFGAYATDCLVIQRDYGGRLLFIEVSLHNTSDAPMRFDIKHFVLVGSDGTTFDPVDVRSQLHHDPSLLSRTGLIPPGAWRTGWLTFDARVPALVARSLYYVAGTETLVIDFEGRYHIGAV